MSGASDGCAEDPEGEGDLEGSGSNSLSSRMVFVRGFFAGGLPLVGTLRAGFCLFEGLGGGESLSSPSDLVSALRFLAILSSLLEFQVQRRLHLPPISTSRLGEQPFRTPGALPR